MTRAVIPVHILIPSSGIVTLKSPITNVGLAVVGPVVAVGLLEGKVVGSEVGLLDAVVGLDVDAVVACLLGLADGLAVNVVGVSVILDDVGESLGLAVGVFVVGSDVVGFVVVGFIVVGFIVVGFVVVGFFVVGFVVVGFVVVGFIVVGFDVVGFIVVGLDVVGLIVVGLLDGRRVGMEMAVLLCVSLRRSHSTAPNNRPKTTNTRNKLVIIGLC
jgi:hypothetical protein